jgi:hypothetical protein
MQRKNGLSLIFSLIPRSISRRLRQLTGKTAGELLRLLCELTIGFRQSAVQRSYRQLAESLGKSVETIARAAKLLLRSGDVVVEARPGRSYRWSVLLEATDIRADPAGICLVRSTSHTEDLDSQQSEGTTVAESETETSVRPPQSSARVEEEGVPVVTPEPDSDSDKISALLKRLMNIGMRRRIARELVKNHDHTLIEAALTRVKGRSDIKNRAAYLLCDVKDGGYEALVEQTVESASPARRQSESAPASKPPQIYSSAEQTRAEMAALEHERVAGQLKFQNVMRGLFQRFEELSETLKEPLRQCWQKHLADLVPRTSRREQLLESPAFKKVAFKEVMERFFCLVDQGASPEEALTQVSSTSWAAAGN